MNNRSEQRSLLSEAEEVAAEDVLRDNRAVNAWINTQIRQMLQLTQQASEKSISFGNVDEEGENV